MSSVAGSVFSPAIEGDLPGREPLASRERIAIIDILRGIALLGILLMNIDDFVGPEGWLHDFPLGLAHPAFVGWHAMLDKAILALKWTFFEGKMRALFGLLFGASTVLLLQRIEQRAGAEKAADVFHRRNMWLIGFGLLHGLVIWNGDILLTYGVIALLVLYPLRHVAPKRLLVAGLTIWLVGGTLGVVGFMDMPGALAKEAFLQQAHEATASGAPLTEGQRDALAEEARDTREAPVAMEESLRDGRRGFIDSVASNASGYLAFYWKQWTGGLMLEYIGSMIFGMGLFRMGFLTGDLSSRTYMKVALVSYAVALPLSLGGLWYGFHHDLSTGALLKALYCPYMVLQFFAAMGNASLMILLIRSGRLSMVAGSLAAVGRMAITNYLFTSILCRFVFSWGPWKLYGTLEYYQYLYVVVAVWVFNILFSRLWLRHFAFGPVEWVWRSLTYWRWQPLQSSPVLPGAQ
ncbi:MAG: hypothetical protein GAK28_02863 [Luteibacter sp.]|uniref:DUF418 domain-containing protein n=1 Tax=Luteibacter sp. TaxID=1886636 RepID=UPI001383C203|nr:DUF418 domain-containing protein [Luteibacter sp.]KAF1005955.1 MAG: hypothetical protein GAK28_02863 [Luteibacter sp.]